MKYYDLGRLSAAFELEKGFEIFEFQLIANDKIKYLIAIQGYGNSHLAAEKLKWTIIVAVQINLTGLRDINE